MVDIPLFDGPSFRQIVLLVGLVLSVAVPLAVTLLTGTVYGLYRCCLCCRRMRRRRRLERQLSTSDLDGRGGGGGGAGDWAAYRPVGTDANARMLHEMAEHERGKRVRRVTWALVYAVVWVWIVCSGAGPLVWIVVMDYLPWWAGWLCADAVLWLGWTLFFPFYCRPASRVDKSTLHESGYVLVEEDDDGFVGDVRGHSINTMGSATRRRGSLQTEFEHSKGRKTCTDRSYNPCKLAGRFLRKRWQRIRRRPFVFMAGLVFWLMLVFVCTFVFEGICISEYPIAGANNYMLCMIAGDLHKTMPSDTFLCFCS